MPWSAPKPAAAAAAAPLLPTVSPAPPAAEVSQEQQQLPAVHQSLSEWGLHQWEIPYSTLTDTGEKLGQGSFGDVIRVQWRGNDVAFKTMRAGSKAHDEQIRAALKEARYMKTVQHENVIGLAGICVDEGHMGLLIEFAERGTLRNVLDITPTMGAQERLRMAVEVLRGLSKLHSVQPRPILHGDVKSVNVLVMADGTCKIADFGMTSGASSAMSISKTHRGGGTPSYTAPELFAHHFVDSDDEEDGCNAAVYTSACDVYSCGVLIWEIMTGEEPWAAEVRAWASKGWDADCVKLKLAREVFKREKRSSTAEEGGGRAIDGATLAVIEACCHQESSQRPVITVAVRNVEALMGRLVDFSSSNFRREYEQIGNLQSHQHGALLNAVEKVTQLVLDLYSLQCFRTYRLWKGTVDRMAFLKPKVRHFLRHCTQSGSCARMSCRWQQSECGPLHRNRQMGGNSAPSSTRPSVKTTPTSPLTPLSSHVPSISISPNHVAEVSMTLTSLRWV
jgi:serine/threonine protein kinase